MSAGTNVKATAAADNMLTGALKSVFAVAEAYPYLKANTNFQELQAELVDTEDKIQASRRFYNGSARDLNTKILVFPNNIFNIVVNHCYSFLQTNFRLPAEVIYFSNIH